MNYFELLQLLRVHLKNIIVIPIICTVLISVGALGFSILKPSYAATSSVVVVGGAFSTVSGVADEVASRTSVDGAVVGATAKSANSTIVFNATASSADVAISAANNAAQKLSSTAQSQQLVTSSSVNEAQDAVSTHRSPILYGALGFIGALVCLISYYVLLDSIRGYVHSLKRVEEYGLTYLGSIDQDESHLRVTATNLGFCGKNRDVRAQKIILVPAGASVSAESAAAQLETSSLAELTVVPPLTESVDVLLKGSDSDAVVIVVEAEKTTFSDIDELVHELKLANIHVGGFVFVPYRRSKLQR